MASGTENLAVGFLTGLGRDMMTLGPEIAEMLAAVVMALTRAERWQAARQFTSSPMGERWFTVIGVVFMITAVALLVGKGILDKQRKRKAA
jgi:hypothetical protein